MQVAAVMQVTPAYLESVASFYDMFELEPAGRHTIYMCTNLSCQLRGARRRARRALRGDRRARQRLEPRRRVPPALVRVPGRLRHRADGLDRRPLPRPADAADAVNDRRAPARGRPPTEVLPERSYEGDYARRLGEREARRSREHEERGGILFKHFDVPGLRRIETYERLGGYRGAAQGAHRDDPRPGRQGARGSGLRGRGGAGFSMGKKASFLPHGDIEKYLCCNADESEPGTFKDRELMHRNPHQLIEGVLIAAYARRHPPRVHLHPRRVRRAGRHPRRARSPRRTERGYVGDDILGSGFSCSLVVHRGAGAYICGEETALLDSLEGKRGNPRLKPPFPANQGLYQGPTLINNVETLSNVPHIVENGADWFR